MPIKDGVAEATLGPQHSALQSAATFASLGMLEKVIEYWNNSHCEDCFILSLNNLYHQIRSGKVIIGYVPPEDNSLPEKE